MEYHRHSVTHYSADAKLGALFLRVIEEGIMPKLGLQLISILVLVLFGLTAWGLSNSLDRITALETKVVGNQWRVEQRLEAISANIDAGLVESQEVHEEIEEVAKFAYNCANNHYHKIGHSDDDFSGYAHSYSTERRNIQFVESVNSNTGWPNGSGNPSKEYPEGLEHCSNMFYTSVYAENNAQGK